MAEKRGNGDFRRRSGFTAFRFVSLLRFSPINGDIGNSLAFVSFLKFYGRLEI